ncbi:MAG TPA: DUF5362 family protein [Rhodanobacteraceae bacterium]|nr:DUF5362 family protein [Rhodanobacteraceae bacterium]
MDTNSATIRELSQPLAAGKGWMKFLGVMYIISGVLPALTIVGLLWAWLPIWLGIVLMQSAGAIERAQFNGDQGAFALSLDKLRLYFVILGVTMIVSLVLMAVFILFFFGVMMAAIGHRF